MTNEERKQYVDQLVVALQRFRTMAKEGLEDHIFKLAEEIIPPISDKYMDILLRLQEMDTINPYDFYNIVTLVYMNPAVRGVHDYYFPDNIFPELDIGLLKDD